MGNRKEKPIGLRLLSSVAAFALIGAAVYLFLAGINFYVGAVLAAAVIGLGVPSVAAGEDLWEMIVGFFESFLDGVMEVIDWISEAISSIFS